MQVGVLSVKGFRVRLDKTTSQAAPPRPSTAAATTTTTTTALIRPWPLHSWAAETCDHRGLCPLQNIQAIIPQTECIPRGPVHLAASASTAANVATDKALSVQEAALSNPFPLPLPPPKLVSTLQTELHEREALFDPTGKRSSPVIVNGIIETTPPVSRIMDKAGLASYLPVCCAILDPLCRFNMNNSHWQCPRSRSQPQTGALSACARRRRARIWTFSLQARCHSEAQTSIYPSWTHAIRSLHFGRGGRPKARMFQEHSSWPHRCLDDLLLSPHSLHSLRSLAYLWYQSYFVFNSFLTPFTGIKTPEQQRAWREKMGLLNIILMLMAGVGFLTFGFTQTVCGKPPLRFRTGTIEPGSVIINGFDYDLSRFNHPAAGSTFNGSVNPLFVGNWGVAGADISFMFQNIGDACTGMFSVQGNSTIGKTSTQQPQWIFPCNPFNQYGTTIANLSGYGNSFTCHAKSASRSQLAGFQPKGQVYYTWDDVKAGNRNLAVYEK
jgi:hypothetical protein